jgi:hypothetical protein
MSSIKFNVSPQLLQNFGVLVNYIQYDYLLIKKTLRIIKKISNNLFSHFYAHIAMHISALDGQGDLHLASTTC